MPRPVWMVAALAAGMLAHAAPLVAQVGSSTDIIMGRVVGPDSAPVAGARVLIVSVATQATKNTLTRADGRFTVLFRDGGGQYRVLVTFIGMRPASLTVQRQADEDRLVVTVKMSSNPQQLSTIQVRGRVNAAPAAASNAGGSGRVFPNQLLERMPLNPGDLEATATLVPGVIPIGATDSTRASFSVAGQPASQNNITVDGMSFLFGTVPQDAVRQTQVVLNAYDVSRGQFTGGQIATTTKSGTSLFQGTANFTGRLPETQFAGRPADAFAQKYSQGLLSAGAGGPFRKKNDRMFYFVSGQFERRGDDALSLATVTDPTLAKLGVNPDSLARFDAIIARLGVPGTARRIPIDRLSTSGSALGRFDLDFKDAHQLMLRADWRDSRQEGARVQPLARPSAGGLTDATGVGGMAMLTSVTGHFINEARYYGSQERQSSEPYLLLPSGVVTVSSTVDARQQLATLQFGGSQFLPRASRTTLHEASDEVSWLTDDGSHRLKLGVLLNYERSKISGVNNRAGTFVYNSLADLETDAPALFVRTSPGTERQSGSNNASVYLGDAWRYSPSLQLTYGLRVEGTHLPDAPAENPLVASTFGRHTGTFPTEVHASPRLGITYLIGNVAGVPSGTFRAGIGEFRGKVPAPIVGYVASNNGGNGPQQSICAGSTVPTPRWSSYDNPNSWPSGCSTPLPLLPPGGSARPNIAVFDDGFGAPRLWRASLALGKRVFTRYGFGFDALYAQGVQNPNAADMNLVTSPAFTLGGEGRPVFAPKASIVQSTGASALAASRVEPAFGTAFALGSGVGSRTGQVTVQLTGGGNAIRSATIAFFSFGYTFMRAVDEGNGYPFGNSFATTAGDPRVREWATSDLERRHNFLATALFVFPHSLELSVIGRALGGSRYTPMVNGDVNADGIRNDRAFIPLSADATQDTSVTLGLQRLLAHADSRARDCLETQRGRIVGRNTCATPWFPGLDLQLNWRPDRFRFDRRVTISVVAMNTLAGIDELLHGASRMHGWGQPAFPDRMLYNVTGFDSSRSRFRYTVNEHFGSPSGATNPFRLPFQLGIQLHAQFGADPQREALKSVYGTADGKPPSIKDLKARIQRQFPLPIKMTLEAADSLKLNLSDAQLARLRALNDSANQQADTLIGAIAQVLSKAGSNPDPGSIAPKLQRTQSEALKIIQRSVTDLKSILTAEQWARLPDRIRFPLQAPAARPQQAQPQQRPPD